MNNLYKAIYEALQDGLYCFNKEGRITQINTAATNMLGFEKSELIGKVGHDMFHVDAFYKSSPIEHCLLYKAFLQGKSYKGIEYFRTKSLEIITVEVSCSPIISNEELDSYVVLFRDVTREKEYEANLKKRVEEEILKRSEDEYFYNKIFETANLGICLTNIEGRFVAVNPAYCSIYGYSEAELVGFHFTKVVPEKNRELLKKLHDDFLLSSNIECLREWEVQRKDGEYIHILASAGKLEHIVGGPYKITTVTDVSEAHKMRELQQKQEAMLIQQSKLAAMGEMLGAIAHQWRQPLNVINCTTLDMKLKKSMGHLDDTILEKSIAKLENLTQEMSRTIEDFMNFFKPDKDIASINIANSIYYTMKIFSAQFKNHNIRVDIDVDDSLHVRGVEGELKQVFLNMLSNSKDAFAEQKNEEKLISIVAKKEEDTICIMIEDSAGGIPENIIMKIFDPYFTTKSHQQGTGIGLYMSSLIISNTFGGKISAENIYNQNNKRIGVKFTITLPITQKEESYAKL